MQLLFLGLLVPFLTLPALLLMERLERWTFVTTPSRAARDLRVQRGPRAELRDSQPGEGTRATPAVGRVGTQVRS